MVTFTLKGIPAELYERLKARAAQNRRSVNSEILVCLEEVLRGQRRDPQELLAEFDEARDRLKVRPFSDAELKAAKNRGRP